MLSFPEDGLRVSWEPPNELDGRPVDRYNIGYGKSMRTLRFIKVDKDRRSKVLEDCVNAGLCVWYVPLFVASESIYVVSLQAQRATGRSVPSNRATLTKKTPPEPEEYEAKDIGVRVMSPQSVLISWVDPAIEMEKVLPGGSRHYTVKYREKGESARWEYKETNQRRLLIDTLSADGMYEFSVRISQGDNHGKWSVSVFQRTPESAPSGPPENFDVKPLRGKGTAVTATWDPPEEPNGRIREYIMSYAPAMKPFGMKSVTYRGSTTSAIIDGFLPGDLYIFKIRATNRRGQGPQTKAFSVAITSYTPSQASKQDSYRDDVVNLQLEDVTKEPTTPTQTTSAPPTSRRTRPLTKTRSYHSIFSDVRGTVRNRATNQRLGAGTAPARDKGRKTEAEDEQEEENKTTETTRDEEEEKLTNEDVEEKKEAVTQNNVVPSTPEDSGYVRGRGKGKDVDEPSRPSLKTEVPSSEGSSSSSKPSYPLRKPLSGRRINSGRRPFSRTSVSGSVSQSKTQDAEKDSASSSSSSSSSSSPSPNEESAAIRKDDTVTNYSEGKKTYNQPSATAAKPSTSTPNPNQAASEPKTEAPSVGRGSALPGRGYGYGRRKPGILSRGNPNGQVFTGLIKPGSESTSAGMSQSTLPTKGKIPETSHTHGSHTPSTQDLTHHQDNNDYNDYKVTEAEVPPTQTHLLPLLPLPPLVCRSQITGLAGPLVLALEAPPLPSLAPPTDRPPSAAPRDLKAPLPPRHSHPETLWWARVQGHATPAGQTPISGVKPPVEASSPATEMVMEMVKMAAPISRRPVTKSPAHPMTTPNLMEEGTSLGLMEPSGYVCLCLDTFYCKVLDLDKGVLMNEDGRVLQDSQGQPKRVVLGEDGRTIFDHQGSPLVNQEGQALFGHGRESQPVVNPKDKFLTVGGKPIIGLDQAKPRTTTTTRPPTTTTPEPTTLPTTTEMSTEETITMPVFPTCPPGTFLIRDDEGFPMLDADGILDCYPEDELLWQTTLPPTLPPTTTTTTDHPTPEPDTRPFNNSPSNEFDLTGKKRFTAPYVNFIQKDPGAPCSLTEALEYLQVDVLENLLKKDSLATNQKQPPKNKPHNITVVAMEGCHSFVILDWAIPLKDDMVSGYMVHSASYDDVLNNRWSSSASSGSHLAVENLKPNSRYYFKVQAKNVFGLGPVSDTITYVTESDDPLLIERPPGGEPIWIPFSFRYNPQHSACKGSQYVKRTWYRKFVGVVLCNSLRYKIFMGDGLKETFYSIADTFGHGEDHCQFVDSYLDGRTGSPNLSMHLPTAQGYYRSYRQEPVNFGPIGRRTPHLFGGWYECGVPIPGKW
uniref:Fibronectin type III domain containing 1 n=1 Tax=Oncorhynchus kisutch TaxID=8019 RepID=A0A8C7GLE9_ONCKI